LEPDPIPDEIWEQTTWEGNRRAQLRHALTLTLRERLQAVEDMAEVAQRLREMREGEGLRTDRKPA
jgi:hypothetical protein